MKKEVVRCFVCVEISERVRKSIGEWLEEFRLTAPDVRWVRNDAFHITLKFCGEIDYSLLYKLENALEHGFNLKKLRPFTLELSGVGAFPGFRNPRVLWAGVAGEDDQIHRIASLVERAALAAGVEPDRRPFHPHVTLARIPPMVEIPVSVLKVMNSKGDEWGEWVVSSVTLMGSELLPDGPRYTPISVFDFTNDREVQR